MTVVSEVARRARHTSQLQFRQMNFGFEKGFARNWLGGSASKSLFWTQLSTAFQGGERFVVRSARALREEISPQLAEQLVVFNKQETHHMAQHLKFDRGNAANGIDVDSCRKRFDAALDGLTRHMPAMRKLSFTLAGEHLTALLAELLLTRPKLMENAAPSVKALWLWHAAEELEHKSTCFDVYLAAGGSYLERIRVLPAVLAFFFGTSIVNTTTLLRQDRALFSRDTLAGMWYLFGPMGLVPGLTAGLIRYLSPWFHPDNEDHRSEIKAWEKEYGWLVQNYAAADAE